MLLRQLCNLPVPLEILSWCPQTGAMLRETHKRRYRVQPDSARQRYLAVAAVLGIHPMTVEKWNRLPGGVRAGVQAWVLSQHATAIRQGGVV